ncbi:MAG TPA: hypothetical protein VLB79_13035, partial [Solirubrobacterales bacterium]|nr:hypothetical protein [Solirubrobacterales bacterium]
MRVGKLIGLGFAIAVVLAAIVVGVVLVPASDGPPSRPSAPVSTGHCAFGSFSNAPWNVPCASWRPYGPESPFNRRLPASPRLEPNSAAIVA